MDDQRFTVTAPPRIRETPWMPSQEPWIVRACRVAASPHSGKHVVTVCTGTGADDMPDATIPTKIDAPEDITIGKCLRDRLWSCIRS